jgi:hypothetical protein
MPRLQRTHPLVPYAYADHLPGNGSGTGASPSGPGAGAGSASTAPLPSLGSSTDPSSTSVRKIYIQHLTSILHSSLLKSDWPRAERAWAILVRCREVDWYERWRWGLAILNAHARRGDEVEDWLKTLRLSAAEVEVCPLPMLNADRSRNRPSCTPSSCIIFGPTSTDWR